MGYHDEKNPRLLFVKVRDVWVKTSILGNPFSEVVDANLRLRCACLLRGAVTCSPIGNSSSRTPGVKSKTILSVGSSWIILSLGVTPIYDSFAGADLTPEVFILQSAQKA